MANNSESVIDKHAKQAFSGLDRDSSFMQKKKGSLTYALNATVESYEEGDQVNYQNENGNTLFVELPKGARVVGKRYISELEKIFFLLSLDNGSEIGYVDVYKATYNKIIGTYNNCTNCRDCLNFNIDHPIKKIEYEINGNAKRLYWVDNFNDDRFIDLNNLPFKKEIDNNGCVINTTDEVDCNLMRIHADFSIPYFSDMSLGEEGTLTTGTYQFGIQYSDIEGFGYTGVYNITNPL